MKPAVKNCFEGKSKYLKVEKTGKISELARDQRHQARLLLPFYIFIAAVISN